ncbi:MAG: DEAD/DEAH box helicase [Rhodospirillaceae bacterium]
MTTVLDDLTRFSELGLTEPLLRAIGAEGYTTPTPIQAGAIPPLLSGRDVVGIAQTGTGKTAAFVLPMLQALSALPRRAMPGEPRALIVAPTRELAAQIDACVQSYGRFLHLSSTVIFGGVSAKPQLAALRRGPDIVVATPGRLLDHMGTGAIRLSSVIWAVLDEADQMLDLGFMPAIRRIMAKVPKARRTALFSATMPAPIRTLAQEFLHDPQEVSVTPAARPADLVTQTAIRVPAAEKRAALVGILRDKAMTSAIVFTRTKHGADRVARHLAQAGLAAGAIHGNKSQSQRERTLRDFKSGAIAILVATDIAARGLDIEGVSHVVNFELPNVPESYVHRIGRTARAGASGIAVSLCDDAERPLLRDIEKLIKRTLIDWPDESKRRASQPSERPKAAATPAKSKSGARRRHGPRPVSRAA